MRAEWSNDNNVKVFDQIPGKCSLKPQPCNAVHGCWRVMTDAAEDVLLGFNDSVFIKQKLSDILMDEVAHRFASSLTNYGSNHGACVYEWKVFVPFSVIYIYIYN